MVQAKETATRDAAPCARADAGDGRGLRFAAVMAVVAGVVYYALFRGPDTPVGAALAAVLSPIGLVPGEAPFADPSGGTLPSFLHTLALTWLALALAGASRSRRAALFALVLGAAVVGELVVGTLDGGDLIAGLLGGAAAVLLARPRPGRRRVARPATGNSSTSRLRTPRFRMADVHSPSSTGDRPDPRSLRRGAGFLAVLSLAFVTGTGPYWSCEDADCDDSTPTGPNGLGARVADPVYLGYEELRGAVSIGEPRPIASLGRLYVFGDRLFLNRRNEGVHVIDNRDPAAPVNASFIAIPGNTELEIRGDNLYADSYVDLVTIDLGGSGYLVLDREENVFPYDEYQNVPDDIVFVEVDRERGVVIGHE